MRAHYRLLLIASWTLLLLLQVWWAIWRVGEREVWTFLEFIMFLLPVGILYASLALLLQPFIFGGIIPLVFASQIVIAVLAVVASGLNLPRFNF